MLQYWGLPPEFWADGAEPTSLTVHKYSGQVLAHEDNFDKNIRRKYGAPFIDYHRADLQLALHKRACEVGVRFHFSAKVNSIDFSSTTVRTEDGQTFTGDLIVAADGLWSKCREVFLGRRDDPVPTGDLAYRIVLDLDDLQDPELRDWVANPKVHFWIGPGSHSVGYSLRAGKIYNIVLLCPDDLPDGVSRQPASLDEMKELFREWDPILQRFLAQVVKVEKWRLMHHEEMDHWVNDRSNLVFMGDACHPMLPYLAQGANSSLEDSAVLGELLARIGSKKQLPHVLRLYERLRKNRGEAIVRETFKQRNDFHMYNGPEQERRDALFLSKLGRDLGTEPFPSRWSVNPFSLRLQSLLTQFRTCPQVQPWLYGYNAIKEVEEAVKNDPAFTEPSKTFVRPRLSRARSDR